MPSRGNVACLIAAVAACSSGGDARAFPDWESVVDTLGDTIVVRTVSGSAWGDSAVLVEEVRIGVFDGPDEYILGEVEAMAVGRAGEIYLMDSQVPALRKYGPDGTHIATFGRDGGGPGEYKRPDGGLAVLPDERVVLRDPGNARFGVYAADGTYLDSWRLPSGGGFNTGRALKVDTEGNLYTLVLLDISKPPWEWEYGLARYTPAGEHRDTLIAPTWDFEPARVTGQREGSSSSTSVPFTGSREWTFSPLGYFVGGVSSEYRIDLFKADGSVLRIEKTWEPVAVQSEESEEQERRITQNFARQFPGWRWNGPSIPTHKPAYRDLYTSEEGRIWVQISQPGEPYRTVEEAREEEARQGRPAMRFRERIAFDVFEPDGRYLGAVRTPDGFTVSPAPIFRGDYVWAVVRDELDVASVVRFRIDRGTESTE